MERTVGIMLALKALGYPGHRCLSRCSCDELPCPLLSWICVQLRSVCPELTDSSTSGDVILMGELRTLLSNMSSPLTAMTSDVLEPSTLNRITEFLISELEAAHLMNHRTMHPEDHKDGEECAKEQRVEDVSATAKEFGSGDGDNEESDQSRREVEMQEELILLMRALDLDTSSLLEDVLSEVKSRIDNLPDKTMADPLLKSNLSSEQWRLVTKMNQVLTDDYNCRRQMMIKRFQVTLESFAWGEQNKERSKALASVPPLVSLAGTSKVCPSLLLTAREDQSYICPIQAGATTSVYKTLMGSVPDRGGRPGEIEPPMPRWDERREKGNQCGRGGKQQRKKYPDKKKKGKKE